MSCYIQAQTDLSLQADFDSFWYSGAFSSFSNPEWPNNITESQSSNLPTTSPSDVLSPKISQTTSRPVHEAAVFNENLVPFQNSSLNPLDSPQPPKVQDIVNYEKLFEELSWKLPACSTPTRTLGLTSDTLHETYHQTPLQPLYPNNTLTPRSVIHKSEKAAVKARASGKVRGNSFKKYQSAKSFQSPAPKLFRCALDPNCDKTFARAEHLARHERKHTKEKPFMCHCSKSFSRLDNWRQHKVSLHKDEVEENERTERRLVEVRMTISRQTNARTPTTSAGLMLPTTPASALRSDIPSSLFKPRNLLLQPSSSSSSASLQDVDLFTIFSGCSHRGEFEMSSSVCPQPPGLPIEPRQLPDSAYPRLLESSRTIPYPSQSTTAYAASGEVPQAAISLGLLEPFSFPTPVSQQLSGSHTYQDSTLSSGVGYLYDPTLTSHLLSPITQFDRGLYVDEVWPGMMPPRISLYSSVGPSSVQMTAFGAPTRFEPNQYHPLPSQEVPASTMAEFPGPNIKDSDFLSFLNRVITPAG